MAKTDFYRIRFPDPDQRYNGTRYLFSLSLNEKKLKQICPTQLEQWVIENTPAWLLTLVGQETLSPLLDFNYLKQLTDIKSDVYLQGIDSLFADCPTSILSKGRTYRRKASLSATLTNDVDISHQLVAYWEQGVKLISALSYTYFYQDIVIKNKAAALQLKRLMVQMMSFKDGKSIDKELTIKKIKSMLAEHSLDFIVAFDKGCWMATKSNLRAVGQGLSGFKTSTYKAFNKASLEQLSNFEHSDDEDDPISNAKQENENPSPKERQGKTPAPPNSTQETVTTQQPTSSTQKQDDKQLTASQSQDEPPASTPNDITETAPSEQKPPEARKKPDLRALARMVPER